MEVSKTEEGIDMKDNMDIKVVVEKYFHELIVINTSFEIYFSMKFNKDWEKIYGISPTYFSLIRKSLLDEVVISFIRLFDKPSKSGSEYSINNYLVVLKERFKDDSDILDGINGFEDSLIRYELILKSLRIWRDKAIAHLDKKYFLDNSSLAEDAPLNIEGLKGLIKASFKFFNDIYYQFDHAIQTDLYYEHDDYKKLIYIVDQHK